jgi:hypothetical protein
LDPRPDRSTRATVVEEAASVARRFVSAITRRTTFANDHVAALGLVFFVEAMHEL